MRVVALVAFACWVVLIAAAPLGAAANPAEPSYGTAVVDGQSKDWDLSTDLFAAMHREWAVAKTLECSVYLRYDCGSQILYVLVLTQPGVVVKSDPAGSAQIAWVAVGERETRTVGERAGIDGNPPDFAWVDRGLDGDPSHVRGFEASMISPPQTTRLFVHLTPFDAVQDSGSASSAERGLPIRIGCGPSAVESTTWSSIKTLYR